MNSFLFTGGPHSVQIVGEYAFIADGQAGMQIIDISNAEMPFIVGNVDYSGWGGRSRSWYRGGYSRPDGIQLSGMLRINHQETISTE
jgi:hypothetical protein